MPEAASLAHLAGRGRLRSREILAAHRVATDDDLADFAGGAVDERSVGRAGHLLDDAERHAVDGAADGSALFAAHRQHGRMLPQLCGGRDRHGERLGGPIRRKALRLRAGGLHEIERGLRHRRPGHEHPSQLRQRLAGLTAVFGELRPERRRTERRLVAEVAHHANDLLRHERQRSARVERRKDAPHAKRGSKEAEDRQQRQILLAAAEAELPAKHRELLGEHAVGEDHALRPAGAPRCEGDEGGVVGLPQNRRRRTARGLEQIAQPRCPKQRHPSRDHAEPQRAKQLRGLEAEQVGLGHADESTGLGLTHAGHHRIDAHAWIDEHRHGTAAHHGIAQREEVGPRRDEHDHPLGGPQAGRGEAVFIGVDAGREGREVDCVVLGTIAPAGKRDLRHRRHPRRRRGRYLQCRIEPVDGGANFRGGIESHVERGVVCQAWDNDRLAVEARRERPQERLNLSE